MENHFDLIVLGAGSGGLAAAKRAARYGAKVAIVEGDKVGGTCVIRGCVPKKLLVYGSHYREYIKGALDYGVQIENSFIDQEILLANVRKEVDRLNEIHIKSLSKLGIKLIKGWGSFSGKDSIFIKKNKFDNDDPIQIIGERILIAVGGRPSLPEIPGSNLAWVSDDMFLQKSYPNKVVVVGGGFIACEFASILNGLGVQVTQLVRGDQILKGFDSDLSRLLIEIMKKKGVSILMDTAPISFKKMDDKLLVSLDTGHSINCGGVLMATGRKPFLNGLELDKAGVVCARNSIAVNADNRTNIENIFAIGDVTDRFNLTPVAIEEGRVFADKFYGNRPRMVNYQNIPKAVFSQPEIASVGLSQEDATSKFGKDNIQTFDAKFKPMSQALHQEGIVNLLKLVVKKDNEKILGCHMLGDGAAEIIQMAAISITMGAKKKDFDSTMALHPTVSEEFVTMP